MRYAAILALVTMAGCSAPASKRIEFLTRSGCVQTKMMQLHLDNAIKASATPITYAVVDLDTLPATDVRKAYPTPTILVGSVDMFGMEEPQPPYPEPT
jgi:hypothetical protein